MKGQRYRFFRNENPFDGETSCELHISIETEESGNKDSSSNVNQPVAVGYSFDATIECQVSSFVSDHNENNKASDLDVGTAYDLELCKTSEDDQKHFSTTIARGTFIPTSISFKADNKKTVTSTIKLEGTEERTV